MNQLLLEKHLISENGITIVSGDRVKHIRNILKLGLGETLRVGIINGKMGKARIVNIGNSDLIDIKIDQETLIAPPQALPCKVVMSLPRPKMMRRVLQNLSALGIKEIHLIHSWRVEKSFWQTPWLKPEIIHEQLILGLEQAMDTHLPEVQIHKLFKPFVEDKLPSILSNNLGIVAHPYADKKCPIDLADQPSTLVIGPEGGFTNYEIEKIMEAGAESVSIGSRILRVETAIPALISRLYPG